jgi:membrane peptidoglycan carboxypeptidase
MVGSADYNSKGGQYNYTYDVFRNTGSSMKVFTYPAALSSRKVTTETQIVDGPSPLKIPQAAGAPYIVYNYDHGTHGTLPLREAWANSLNIPAVKTEQAIGVSTVVQFARSVGTFPEAPVDGVYSTDAPLANYGLALTLGGYPVRLLDEAHGLATIADLGVYHDVEAILSVKDAKGHVLYQADPALSRRQAMDPGAAFITAQVMSDNFNRRQIFGLHSTLHLDDHTVASKTGTADDFKDDVTIGFTPDVATIFWIGDTLGNDHVMVRGSSAESTIAPAWHDFMENFLRGVKDHWYAQPGDVVRGDPTTQPHAWFLADQRSVAVLPGDTPKASPSPVPSAVPPDPGAGPVLAIPSPNPEPSPNPNPSPPHP